MKETVVAKFGNDIITITFDNIADMSICNLVYHYNSSEDMEIHARSRKIYEKDGSLYFNFKRQKIRVSSAVKKWMKENS